MAPMKLPEQLIEKAVRHVNRKRWWHVPPTDRSAYSKRGKFFASTYAEAEYWGRPLDKPERVSVANPLIGDELTISRILDIAPQREGMNIGEIAAHDARWRNAALKRGFDAVLLMSPTCFARFKVDGTLPRSMELNVFRVAKAKQGIL